MKAIIFLFFTFQIGFIQAQIAEFYKVHVSSLQESLQNSERKPELKVKDDANGFYSYDLNSMGITGFEEMAYYVSKSGKKFVCISSFGCGPLCGASTPEFFELNNGKLVNKTKQYLTDQVSSQINELWENKRKSLKTDEIPYGNWVKLPRKGTTIQFGIMEGAEENGKFIPVCDLVYNSETGTFSLVKK